MKPAFEQLVPNFVSCGRVRGRTFGCQWHFHPELELTLVLSGGSHRWVGDNISPIAEGDLVFLGSNLPHDYRNDSAAGSPQRSVNAINVHFRPDFLGQNWLDWGDMKPIKQLFEQATLGLEITGRTRDSVARHMGKMLETRGIKRLILLLEILQELNACRSLKRIASPGFSPELQVSDKQRMGLISAYIHDRITDPIYISDVARHAGMTESTFSRYFRSMTRKTFPAYLNELRVARVCRLLAETDATIGEIAVHCGFDSMANFEKQFHRLEGCTPKQYRQRALRIGLAVTQVG